MGSRYIRASRKQHSYNVSSESLIERMKRIRALNCNPSDFGIDTFVWRKLGRFLCINR